MLSFVRQSGKRDSNSRPQPWQGCALPTELFPHILKVLHGAMTVLRVQIYVVFCFLQNIFENYFTFLSPPTSMC